MEWQAAQNAFACDYLRSWPGYDALQAELVDELGHSRASAPRRAGERWFRIAAGGELAGPVLTRSERFEDRGEPLVAAAAAAPELVAPHFDWFFPSPQGSFVACGVSEAGTEQSVIVVVDGSTGEVLADRTHPAFQGRVAWLPDESGFYYNGYLTAGSVDQRLFFHAIGGLVADSVEDVPRYTRHAFAQVSDDGRWVGLLEERREPRLCALNDRLSPEGWHEVLPVEVGACFGLFDGDSYVAIVTDCTPRGSVVKIPLATYGDRSTWRELVPETNAVLWALVAAGEELVLSELVEGLPRIRLLSRDGSPHATVPIPSQSGVALRASSDAYLSWARLESPVFADPDGITFVEAASARAPSVRRYERRTGRSTRLGSPSREHPGFVSKDFSVAAGAPVPLHLVHRADLDMSEPRPLLITGYGGWNSPVMPGYLGGLVPFVRAGGVFALGHFRGGGDFGRDWWLAGSGTPGRQRVSDDLYASAEWLVSRRIAAADALAFMGVSAGGLLGAVAAAQRPELFRAVVCLVPILDILRMQRDPWNAGEQGAWVEYGDARDPEQADWLLSYTPYYNLRQRAYPAMLISCGGRDPRAVAWHSRKLAARLQEHNAADTPILLRVWEDFGHFNGHGDAHWIAEWVSFVMGELGLRYDARSVRSRAS
jgi:prolyl oligopeptidase